ncbi:ABC transporter substrate-binding protein [Archangium lipolyticum]|uniref:ABC transporter substrate-binding protein n=1 Tax=Archangium lipolyticum TaxID=2970465 RepID=UPI002149F0DF|nr:ABC transporter substrate-binding protein [Archangium lipolyticum]
MRSLVRVFGLLLLFIMPSCAREQTDPLRLGTCLWPGSEPLFLARELGFTDDRSVRMVEYATLGEINRAFRNGVIDAALMTLDMALTLQQHGFEPRVVLVLDYSHGGDALMARPEVRGLEELRGRKVAVEDLTTSPYVLGRALAQAGLQPSDVQIVRIPVDQQVRAYEAGRVDAVVTFEPFVDRLRRAGAHELLDSSALPEEIIDVLVVREDRLERYSRQVEHLLQGWFQSLEYLRRSPDDAVARMSPRLDMSPSEFTTALRGLRLLSLDENRALLGAPSPALVELARPLQRFMLAQGLMQEPIQPEEMLDARFLEEVREDGR